MPVGGHYTGVVTHGGNDLPSMWPLWLCRTFRT